MALDVYDPCPCGSGKKLKFCCHAIVSEMDKVVKLRENNQPRMALQVLEGLRKQYTAHPWLETTLAAILLEERDSEQARQILKQLLEQHPDHLFALALLAMASFVSDGLGESRPSVYRAFQRCSRAHPQLISQLALGIAAFMHVEDHLMAARQHLVLAMKLAPNENKQDIFLRLLDFDNNGAVPYPLRGVHELSAYSGGSPEVEKEARNAIRLAEIGCYGPAGRIFAKLAELAVEQDAADLWQNAGFCRVWDGDEDAAAIALHRAAGLSEDFETAVEFETIAQLLELDSIGESAHIIEKAYQVSSVGKLLTLLDAELQFIRAERPEKSSELADEDEYPIAVFQILDRPPLETITDDSTLEEIPRILAQATIFSEFSEEDRPAEAILVGLESDNVEASRLFEEVAGDEVAESEPPQDEDPIHEVVPREFVPIRSQWYFDPSTPFGLQRDLKRRHWERFLAEVWPNSRVAGLGGKTPVEVIGDDDSVLRLAARLYVLDAMCDRHRIPFNPVSERDRFQLDPITLNEIDDNVSLSTFSVMQTHRLSVKGLTDAQLLQTLNRALLIRHVRYLHQVLIEIESRPTCMKEVDSDRIYMTLVDIVHERIDHQQALQWVDKGYDLSQKQDDAFQLGLRWKLRELALRLDDPSDSQVNPLLTHLWDYYGPKLPQLREHLEQVVSRAKISSPWGAGAETVAADANLDAGVWMPSSEPSEKKKLWLPGQD